MEITVQGLMAVTRVMTLFETFESEPEAVRSFTTAPSPESPASPS